MYTIKTELAEDLQIINGDPGHLEQVLMNLLVNARDAMPEGGEITMSTKNIRIDPEFIKTKNVTIKNWFVLLSVTDSGMGMDAETVSHIFEPFFSTKGAAAGTGLGLSVVYGIITQHGGWVDVDSKPGRGTTFMVFFPAIEKEATAGKAGKTAAELIRSHGERILLVEDEDSIRKMVEKMLVNNGYVVIAVPDAEAAVKVFDQEEGRIDLVFSDVILPGKDGLWLVEGLLKKSPGLSVLFASSYSDLPSHKVVSEKGYKLLLKPYELSRLMQVISDLITRE